MSQIELFPTEEKNKVSGSYPNSGVVHKCSVCKKKFYWNQEARWFGKLENKKGLQECGHKVCSTNCYNNSRYRDK